MYIAQINSTNTYLKQHPELESVYTSYQTAGRGQVGNSWESERGKNVLLSVRLRPQEVSASAQWSVCEAVSVALWQVVAGYVPDTSKLTIKWPNDLYYGDNKLAGVLIEHTLCGAYIDETIVGIGLNVNQTAWVGNAPNPISLLQINGQEQEVKTIAVELINVLQNINVASPDNTEIYERHLYRRTGWFWWEERKVDLQPTMDTNKSAQSFEAQIAGITPQGALILRKRRGEECTYHFKQIKYIL